MKNILFIAFLSCFIATSFAQSVQLVKPVAGDVWKAYTVQQIQWTSTNVANVKIECSLDSGRTWTLIASSYPASATYYNWTVPYKPSDSCYIRISDVLTPPDPGMVYNNPFKIPSAALSIDSLPSLAYAKTVLPITWSSGGIQKVDIYASYNGGVTFTKIADTINTGNAYYNWIVPDSLSNNCFIKIRSAAADSTVATTTTAFEIRSLINGTINKFKGGVFDGHSSANNNPKQVLLSVLANSESVAGNATYNIRWQQNNINLVNLFFSQDNGANWQTIAANIPASSLSYSWVIPSTPTNTGKLKIVDALDSTVFNVPVANLIIKSKSLKITSPDSLSNAYQNTVLPIAWTSSGVSVIRVSLLSGNLKKVLADSVPSGNEMYNWVIPQNAADSFRILLADRSDSTLNDTSVFVKLKTLSQPAVTKYRGGGYDGHAVSANTRPVIRLTYPAGGELLSVSTRYNIKWTSTNLDKIRFDVSLDSGRTWSLLADSIAASAQSYDWKSPLQASTRCFIRIRNSQDSSLYHMNGQPFTLLPKNISNKTDSLNWIKGTAKSIEWQSGGVDSVKVAYKTSVNSSWIVINDKVPALSTILNWVLPVTIGDSVWIKITDITDSLVTDEKGFWGNMKKLVQSFSPVKYQGGSFDGHAQSSNILTKKILITNPVAFETVAAGSTYAIKWTAINISDSVSLQFSIDGGSNWATIGNVSAAANSYLWQVPKKYAGGQNGNDTAINSNQCQLRALAIPVSGNILIGSSDRTFTISSVTPVIKSVSPTSGSTGDSIIIKGIHLLGVSSVKLNTDTVSRFTVLNDSTISATVGTGSSGPVYAKNAVGFNTDTTTKFLFIALQKPVINSFTPATGVTGTTVQISGTGFKKVDSVQFGGLNATSFLINSDSLITAVVGMGNTGKIGLHNSAGNTLSANTFTYYPKPRIVSFTPASGAQGTYVQIKGRGFTGVNMVSFGAVVSDSVYVQNDSTIIARVATGNTGLVRVANPAANDSSESIFTFITQPVINGIIPDKGSTGSSILINGAHFTGASMVKFGSTAAASFVITNDSTITAIVGSGSTGPVSITNSAGTSSRNSVKFTFIQASKINTPLIKSFTPEYGTAGTSVTISGSNFIGASAVKVGGVAAASFTVLSDTLISFVAGNGATGNIVVTNASGNDTSLNVFTYYAKPVLSSFEPASGYKGTWVQIKGRNLTGINTVSFGGVLADSITLINDSTIVARVGQGNSGTVRVSNPLMYDSSQTLFTYLQKPVIQSFSPEYGISGTTIQVSGIHFTGVDSVLLGSVPAASYKIVSDSILSVLVGNGATGKISLTNPAGRDTSSKTFTYYPKPLITSFSPSSGPQGVLVQIKGNGFTGVTSVSFGGTKADSMVVISDSLIYAKPGSGDIGTIIVSNPLLSDSSKSIFTYLYKPLVNSFTPTSGATGTGVTISGAHFSGAQSVLIGGTSASFTVVNDSTITAIVGTGTTGKIAVTNSYGTNTSSGIFTYFKPPVINSFTPVSGAKGTVVTISGTGFNGVSSVYFDSIPAISFVVNSDSSITAIVGAGSSGLIKVDNSKGTGISSSSFTYNKIVLSPAISSYTPKTAFVGGVVSIIGKNLFLPQSLTIGGVPAIPLSNNGDTIAAMVMPGTTSGPISITTSEGSATSSDSSFTVVTAAYPAAQQGSKLTDSVQNGVLQQGSSVAISADGNTAVIGAIGDNNNKGAAWIYKRSMSTWQQVAKLVAYDNTGAASIGGSVAISADGKTVLVGGETDNKNTGAAWVFVNTGSNTWVQQGVKLVTSGVSGSQTYIGHSVSLSADGNTAVIGAVGDNNSQGAVLVFTRNGSSWTQQLAKLIGSDNAGASAQGSAVAISADGNTIVEGGVNDNTSAGAVWVFVKKNGSWIQQGTKLLANDKTGAARQGTSVAINADGSRLVYGGSTDNGSVGAAWVFARKDSVWAQDGIKLTGKGILGKAAIGSSVGLSADGNVVIVGNKGENENIGSASVYKRSGGYWKQQGLKLSASDAAGMSMQGNAVAISADANTALIGGLGDLNELGAAWAFVPANNWIGSVSNDWDVPGNWSYGRSPQQEDVVLIPKTVNSPVLISNSSIRKLILDSAALLTLNGSLNVSGGISNNGSISGSASLMINNKSVQQIIGKGQINSLTIGDSSLLSIDDDTTSISGSIVPRSGVLKANGKLRLLSTSNGSASVGKGSGNYLTGNVIVQRFVSNLPDWRMIGFPFADSSKILANDLKSFFPYGYSAFSYSEPSVTNGNINTGWAPFAYGQISPTKGMLFSGTPVTTIQLTAPVNTGTIKVPLSYTQFNLNNGWNLISNPFPANIDWNTIITNNPSGLQNAIYRYDPYASTYASYVNGVSTGNLNNIIENGAGFFVRSIGATALNVSESDKTSSGPVKSLAGFPSSPVTIIPKSAVRLSLFGENENSGDEVVVRWGVDPATDNFDDNFDAFDLGRNRLADVSVVGDDKTLYSIFHGSSLKPKSNEKRTINVRTVNMHPGIYKFESKLLSPMFDNNELYLVDNYQRKSTLISRDSNAYSFVVTSDSLSASNSRFKLIFNYQAQDTSPIMNDGIQLLNNPSSVNQFVLLSGSDFKQVEWKLVDQRGVQIKSGMMYDLIKGQARKTQTSNISAGMYFIRLIADGQLLPSLKWIKQ